MQIHLLKYFSKNIIQMKFKKNGGIAHMELFDTTDFTGHVFSEIHVFK